MMPRAGTRIGRVKKLARAGGYSAMGATGALVLWPRWMWVAVGCTLALTALGTVAAVLELPPERRGRGSRRKGSGLSGRGRDDDGPAGEAVHRWRTLAVVSRLMPAPLAAGGWRRQRACWPRSRPPGAARRSAATCCPCRGW